MNKLVSFQCSCRVKALATSLAAERCHIHGGSVPFVDDSAISSLSSLSCDDLPVSLIVSYFLVFLQLAVVKKRFSTQVTHEGLGRPVEQHVDFKLVVLNEALPTDFTFERFFTGVDTDVSLQVVLQSESRSTRLTCEDFPSVDRLVCAERSPLHKSFTTYCTFVGVLPGMSAFMALQRDGVPEALTALGALVWFLH